jgi:hypothetical protein
MRSHQSVVIAAFLAVASNVWAGERTIRLDVDNATADRILEVYVTPTKSPKWGPNLLKEGALPAGRGVTLSFSGECGLYDVRIVAPGGREYLDDEVSLCEEHDVLEIGKGEVKRLSRSQSK